MPPHPRPPAHHPAWLVFNQSLFEETEENFSLNTSKLIAGDLSARGKTTECFSFFPFDILNRMNRDKILNISFVNELGR
jgi:hypothetical protein